ncbi:MAG TPA: sialidase family protein [Phycisphaerales bacterium]|nr:sialidase family protein [Phycisphaerales bacterium]
MLTFLLAAALVADQPIQIDLNGDHGRQVIVDREPGVYLGHVSTVLLADRKSILAVYPQGHGTGPIVMKRSDDAGLTWSERLPTPASWATSKETPTLFRMGTESLILFSGLHPIRAARSSDDGRTWSELEPIGDFGGIVAMGGVADLGGGRFATFFHDDGRFLHADGEATDTFTLYQTNSDDAGATWSPTREIWSGSDVHLCEPGVVVSPDGGTLALLLRENRRVKRSHAMLSRDGAATWSDPHELPNALTGDRHIAAYARDGRLVVTFRCMAPGDPWRGDWVAWVGAWDDLTPGGAEGGSGEPTYLVRLKDNLAGADCGYAGLEALPDGTLVATTYGAWSEGEQPFILSVRFTVRELDGLAAR